jgi:peptidoglycan biosynthesis protein MviN/MurJ (putative lipid II flippase)
MKPSAPVTRHVRRPKTSPYSFRSAPRASSAQVESDGFGFITLVEAVEETKPSPLPGRSAVRSGLATGLSFLALSGSGALAGVYLAHKFGRNDRTDGFMAAYGVYLVLVLGAQAFRMVVVPDLTRAEAEGRLREEFRAYVVAFVALAVPVSAVVVAFHGFFGELITGRLPSTSANIAGRALAWLVPAAFAQLLAALAASALAARDSYLVAAAGFALGGLGGLVFFVLAADAHGLISLAWGVALNSAIALGLPLGALVARGGRLRHLRMAGALDVRRRLFRLVHGGAVPFAIQGLYVIALRFAAGTGEGSVTSLSYAYLLAAMFVSATAFSLSLIAAAPLTRRGVDPDTAADHVVHSAWVSLVIVGAASGIVALVGGRVVAGALGHAYSGAVGDQLGRLVVYLAPWMVAHAAFSITYPLLFVMHRTRLLIPLALAALAVDIPISIAGRAWAGLTGVAVALGISTLLLVLGLMAALAPRTLVRSTVGLARLAVIVGAATALAFGGASLLLGAVPAAFLGLVVYTLILLAVRQLGLAEAWHYVRALH